MESGESHSALLPQALHQVTISMSERGIPRSCRHMNGYGRHTYSMINAEAEAIVGKCRESNQRDLYASLENGAFPRRNMQIQVMGDDQAKNCPFNPSI